MPITDSPMDFVEGLQTIVTNGDAHTQTGMAAHVYVCNQSMIDRYFSNADGEMLIVPQQGGLRLLTETGVLEIKPGDISIIPRGLKFRVELLDSSARGYVAENYGSPLELPELGPIGANALANPRDFEYAVAHFEDDDSPCEMVMKFQGQLHATQLEASPLDVVAWHGNVAACKYDLTRFCPVGAVSFDHPDPSIYTVLTSRSDTPGMANLDFVIFPERWAVAEDTFRPPWYHSNVMSEFMGLIRGVYDAKLEGFVPGGMSLHNGMLPHGPDRDAFEGASNAELKPHKLEDTLAFMFESRYSLIPTAYAMTSPHLQHDYASCWDSLQSRFDPLNT